MKTLSKNLIKEAEKLSSEWGSVCYIVENKDKSFQAIVWNNYKYEKGTSDERPVVASVDRAGWTIQEKFKYIKIKNYRKIEFKSKNIESAVKQLKSYKDLVYGIFNGKMLYSDIDNLDTAYKKLNK